MVVMRNRRRSVGASLYRTALGRGEDVRVGVRAAVQAAAVAALRDADGSLVALDVRSGRILAWAGGGAGGDPGRSLVRPGSTLKVLLALGGRHQGVIADGGTLTGDSEPRLGIENVGGLQLGPLTLDDALAKSSNTAFADLALRLGVDGLKRTLRRGDIGVAPLIDLPSTSARRGGGSLTPPGRDGLIGADGRFWDPDRHQRVSVLQLASLAASVATGRRRALTFATRIGDRPVHTSSRPRWSPMARATVLRGKRVAVTSGTAASLRTLRPPVAAKTGTIRLPDGKTQASLIVLVPSDRPRYAVGVTVRAEGNVVADDAIGPIIKSVLRSLSARREG